MAMTLDAAGLRVRSASGWQARATGGAAGGKAGASASVYLVAGEPGQADEVEGLWVFAGAIGAAGNLQDWSRFRQSGAGVRRPDAAARRSLLAALGPGR